MKPTRSSFRALALTAGTLQVVSCAQPGPLPSSLTMGATEQARRIQAAEAYADQLHPAVSHGDARPAMVPGFPRVPSKPLTWPSVTRLQEPFLPDADSPDAAGYSVMALKRKKRPSPTPTPIVIDPNAAKLDGKLLVVSATGDEPSLAAIKQTLEYMGTPYAVWVATQHPGGLTADVLASGTHGFYQGVILVDNTLGVEQNGAWVSALSQAEWDALAAYEVSFNVRQVSWYAYPTPDLGFAPTSSALDTSATPLNVTLTADGQKVFSYMPAGATVPIKLAYTYQAQLDGTGSSVPLLADAAGNALAIVHTYADGRQVLAQTFDNNPYLLHSLAFSYGLVSWVTRGLFVGERHTYACAQVDDVFLDNDMFRLPGAPINDSREYPGEDGPLFRLNGADIDAFTRWQQARQANPLSAAFKTDLCFNGLGTSKVFFDDPEKQVFLPDTLTPKLKEKRDQYKWISHTYSHPYLDGISYTDCTSELLSNFMVADKLGLRNYQDQNLVTPNVSGLGDPNAMKAIVDAGVRFIVSDTSVAGQDNPTPNAGIVNALQPAVLEIPRRPTNLYYNVSTPNEWVTEYNAIYRAYWGRDLTYAEILDNQSDMLATFMLRGEADPWMFHQPNMRAYDGTHSLLGDLLDAAFTKYARLMSFPIVSPQQHELGTFMANRMAFNAADVTATIVPGVAITLTANAPCTVPVTGVTASGGEVYANTPIAHIRLAAGQSVTLPLAK